MRGEAQELIKFFDGADKRFVIPLYQRNYDWKVENCEQLYQDLMHLYHTGGKSHFFGSIVSSIQPGTEDRFIIDGQQRITTVSLLLIAMVNAFNEEKLEAKDPKLARKIRNCYLVDEFQDSERKIKLKPIKKDMEAFDALLDLPSDKYIKGSNVTRNYLYFYEKIISDQILIDDLFEMIKKLEVIIIRLEEDDDPQLIFESLNSTGLDLSEADKIRNYLLMSLSPKKQDDLYTAYWNPIEEFTNYDASPFVRDYLTMKQGLIGRLDKIYYLFKRYAEANAISREELMKDMYHYAKIYSQIERSEVGEERLNQRLRQLRTLDSTVAYPFFMAFFDYANANNLSIEERCQVVQLIESYWARRIICAYPSNALNKVFATLHREVVNLISKSTRPGAIPSYIDVLTYLILKKSRSAAYPQDDEVRSNFKTRQVYNIPTNTRMFLLERLENRDSNERHDVVSGLTEKIISIEHIMPQNLTKSWKESLGEQWERIHDQYLHTMANLTLTGYNSQYSNRPFTEKRDVENGFKDSAYRLNEYLKSCEQWGEAEILERQKRLLEVVFRLWPKPTTTFEPLEREAYIVALDDEDFEFKGISIQAYQLDGTRSVVTSWKEMFLQVCQQLLLDKRSTVEWLCANEKYGFSTISGGYRVELAPGIFAYADTSTATKISYLRGLFEECGISPSLLIFELRPKVEEVELDLF